VAPPGLIVASARKDFKDVIRQGGTYSRFSAIIRTVVREQGQSGWPKASTEMPRLLAPAKKLKGNSTGETVVIPRLLIVRKRAR